jgi:hypothetical protein
VDVRDNNFPLRLEATHCHPIIAWNRSSERAALTGPFPTVITDFEDPKFDLEAFLLAKAKENP